MPDTSVLTTIDPPRSVAEIFHRLNRVLPDDQCMVTVTPTTKVSEALKLMKKGGFSQLPVVEGKAVLGIVSFKSVAEGVVRMGKSKNEPADMPVEEFIEKVQFARVTDEFDTIFDWLDRDNAVLVGEPDRLQGIVTAMDVLRYLYGVANHYVLIAEIELALRALIAIAVQGEVLTECAKRSLGSKYEEGHIPTSLSEMEFNDYIQLVGHGENWKLFAPVFGGMRETTRTKLEEIRDLRNDIFHFRRELTWEDHEKLVEHRDWMLLKARKADARQKHG
jgi:CBS domain-containing protein